MSKKNDLSLEEVLQQTLRIPFEHRSAEFKAAFKNYYECSELNEKHRWELALASHDPSQLDEIKHAERQLKSAEKKLNSSIKHLKLQFKQLNYKF